MSNWHLKPGDKIKRTELHELYGGRRQGGISPSSQSPNIMIFTSASGEQYGYFDGWQDGIFHYTGEGQVGDQEIKQGNRALAEHKMQGKAVRLFNGSSGDVVYDGEFQLDEATPFYVADAPDFEKKDMRKVLIFRLQPLDRAANGPLCTARDTWRPNTLDAECTVVDAESNAVESFSTSPPPGSVAERREAKLVQNYQDFIRRNGKRPLVRLKIKPAGEAQYLFTDLYDPDSNTIIESKGTVTRESIRMAIGQLLDYSRFTPGVPKLAVLLPERPRQDLEDLLNTNNIKCIFAEGDIFLP